MSQSELLSTVAAALDRAGVPFMVTGSVASSVHGYPRSTHDIDLVVSMSAAKIGAVAAAFPEPEFYFSTEAAREAIARGGMFNLLQTTTGDKVDFWMLTDDPFDRSRFARRHIEPSASPPVPVSTAEDIILAKLRWAMESGGSERQFRDALGVYEVQAGHLDIVYLTRWAGALGVSELWERLLREAAGS